MNDEQDITDDDLQKMVEEAGMQDEENQAEEQAEVDQQGKEEELTAALARCMADLQNYKRRTEEERGRFVRMANAELLLNLLPAIDNLDRSVQHLPEDLEGNDWAKGVLQIHEELLKTMEKMGVKKVKTVGETLNPEVHEALMTEPGEKDVITEELEPGYTYHDEVLKAAKVKVGDGSKK